jgi:excisionase family DNA binding protein
VDGEHLWRVAEVAERLAMSVSKVWQLVLSGEIPSVHVGRSRRVRSTDLTTWMESLTPTPTTRPEQAIPEVEPGIAEEGGTSHAEPSG